MQVPCVVCVQRFCELRTPAHRHHHQMLEMHALAEAVEMETSISFVNVIRIMCVMCVYVCVCSAQVLRCIVRSCASNRTTRTDRRHMCAHRREAFDRRRCVLRSRAANVCVAFYVHSRLMSAHSLPRYRCRSLYSHSNMCGYIDVICDKNDIISVFVQRASLVRETTRATDDVVASSTA